MVLRLPNRVKIRAILYNVLLISYRRTPSILAPDILFSIEQLRQVQIQCH